MLIPQIPKQPRQVLEATRSPELALHLPGGWQEPMHFGHHSLAPQDATAESWIGSWAAGTQSQTPKHEMKIQEVVSFLVLQHLPTRSSLAAIPNTTQVVFITCLPCLPAKQKMHQ